MSDLPKPGDRVTWWWIADNCRCPTNGHQDPDVDKHPMVDGREPPALTECTPPHHRALTGYPATVVAVAKPDDHGHVACDLEVEMPAHIGPGSRHNLVTRQGHSVLAGNGERPTSGQCTPGSIEDEIARHAARATT